MIFEQIKLNIDINDDAFDCLYPMHVNQMARRHFTPINVAKTASEFLVQDRSVRVLDIGSGVGKFCMIGACHTKAVFHGVEQRKWMVDLSNEIAWQNKISNVRFFQMNFLRFPVKEYSSIYFFNSFLENIDPSAVIDKTVPLGVSQYELYSNYLKSQLELTKKNTRLATYWVDKNNVPDCFKIVDEYYEGKLILWKKMGITLKINT